MVKTALLGVIAGLLISACGSVGIGSEPSPSPSTGPGFGFDAMVTEQDRAITIQVGQKLEVVLHAKPGMTNWSNVRSSDTSVLTPIVNPAATAVRGVTLARFRPRLQVRRSSPRWRGQPARRVRRARCTRFCTRWRWRLLRHG